MRSPSPIRCRLLSLVIVLGMHLGTFSSSRAMEDPLPEGSASGASLAFESHVRPILKTHCFHCHGEAGHKESDLDLRLVRFMKLGGQGGAAIVPGAPEQSLLWQRVDADEMPPEGKHLSDAEKDMLKKWLQEGATTKREEPEQPSEEDWTEEERNHWAFQKVERRVPPAIDPMHPDRELSASPIDAFLHVRLKDAGLSFSPTADRASLIRRLAFDLLGLAPEPEEVEAFVADGSPDAWERLVDRYLADPRYGERWGRHWLDVAGYADSDGYTEQDTERPWAFQYRDYVIRAHNDDLPMDRFVIEQLAGDELVQRPWENLSEDDALRLAATGFLRTAPDGTGQEGVDQDAARNDVIAETIKIVSGAMLGMTVGCAQCHDHRYDPISQRDYYRLRAVFEPGMDWKQWRDKQSRLVSLWTQEERQRAAAVDHELAELEGKRNTELDAIVTDIFEKEVMKLPEDQRDPARAARGAPAGERTPEQQKLLRDHPSLNVDRGSASLYDGARINEFNKQFETQQADIRSRRPPERFVPCFSEVPEQLPATYVFYRGDIRQPRDAIEAGGLSILGEQNRVPSDDPSLPSSGRRLALARHWTEGVHPLVSRALVNRIWMHHFGRGLTSTPGDFGRLGELPSHPELLDWLASELVEGGWSRKRLHRGILVAHAYRQSSLRTSTAQQYDPENRWYSHMHVRRLQAETLRDSMLQSSGMLVPAMHGPPSPVNPDEVGQFILGKATRDGNGILVAKQEEVLDSYRRSVYVQVRRSMPLGILEPFDPPSMVPNCDRRAVSTVATQSLMLMNNSTILKLAEHFALRVQREVGNDPAVQADRAWVLAYGQKPNDAQRIAGAAWIAAQRRTLTKPSAEASTPGEATNAVGEQVGTLDASHAETTALALYCQALFSSNRFLYVE